MALFWLILFAGLAPLIVALALLPPAHGPRSTLSEFISSSMLCTLAFNLTFLWQEIWLVLAKALTPGLHPVLYHNNHEWTGTAQYTELLQGVGAVATFITGLTCLLLLTRFRYGSGTSRLFLAWLALEGIFQALSQVAIGALFPGNDVGRAFAFLDFDRNTLALALVAVIVAMAGFGRVLAQHWPRSTPSLSERLDRSFIWTIAVPALVSVVLLIPFREPRALIEVVLIPVVVHALGVGWTSFGALLARRAPQTEPALTLRLAVPAAALLLVLGIFRGVLARGIPF